MKAIDKPFERYVLVGLWGLPVFAALLFIGTITHQPPPQTDLSDWSKYVTTNEFLLSHLVASILGGVIGIFGMIALAVVLANNGKVRGGLWAMMTGVTGLTLNTALFGVAAWAQPAVGRFYLAGHHAQAQALYYDATQPVTLVITGLLGSLLFVAGIVIFGVAVARSAWLPRAAGIAFAVSGPLFFVGAFFDNFVESIASVLMVASTVWIAIAVRREDQSGQVTTGEVSDVQVAAGG